MDEGRDRSLGAHFGSQFSTFTPSSFYLFFFWLGHNRQPFDESSHHSFVVGPTFPSILKKGKLFLAGEIIILARLKQSIGRDGAKGAFCCAACLLPNPDSQRKPIGREPRRTNHEPHLSPSSRQRIT